MYCVITMIPWLGWVGAASKATHVCATPALWDLVGVLPEAVPHLKVLALGGEPMPSRIVQVWASKVSQIYPTC